MRASLITFSFLASLMTPPCFADGMGVPAKAATPKAAPANAETPASAPSKAKTGAKTKAAAKAPTAVLPDDLTPHPIPHVAVCPPPKIAPCVIRKPVTGGYRVLTNGVDVADDGVNWIVDFGRGPKETMFLLQVLEPSGSLHEIAVRFQTKPGMQKTPTLPSE